MTKVMHRNREDFEAGGLLQSKKYQARDLENLIFNEETLAVEFDESCTKKISESFYEFARDQKESDEIERVRAVCKVLNQYCKEIAGIGPADMHVIAERLHLKCEIIPGSKANDPGSHYTFTENIAAIRARLEHAKNAEEIEKGLGGE